MTFQTKTSSKTDLNLTLNGITLPKTQCTKFLGTWLDDRLVWTEHVKKTEDQTSQLTRPTQEEQKIPNDTCNENAILCPN